MNTSLKPGDRVRVRNTVTMGTVVRVAPPGETGPDAQTQVVVEWDGHEGSAARVRAEDLEFVRPPPRSW